MHRGAAVFVVVALALAACGSDKKDVTTTRQTGTDPASGANAVNALALDLLHDTVGLDKGNVALSPWSIATALAMARLGAKGDTAAQMDKVLHAGTGLADAMNALDQQLASRTGEFPGGDDNLRVELNAANRAFAQRDLTFEQPYLDGLGRYFGSSLGLVDYKGATDKARDEINQWVSDQTRQRIPELLAQGVLDTLTRLVLVNAVYLKADWRDPFSKDATADGVFHAPSGDVTVPLMHGSDMRRFVSGDGWKAVDLLYAGDKLAMTILVPDAGRYDAVVGKLDATTLSTLDGAERVDVDLALPKFDIAKATDLKDELIKLGMPVPFSDQADFGGITTAESLQIADVIHQANVTVDEKGTVAAAATALTMRATSAPARVERLVVDRPFVFLLRDLPTGAIVFAGQVTNPTAR